MQPLQMYNSLHRLLQSLLHYFSLYQEDLLRIDFPYEIEKYAQDQLLPLYTTFVSALFDAYERLGAFSKQSLYGKRIEVCLGKASQEQIDLLIKAKDTFLEQKRKCTINPALMTFSSYVAKSHQTFNFFVKMFCAM